MPDHEVPVLIVGGSLVGMSAAMLLGHHGVRALVVEHHRGTAIHPRAAMINQRTMEVFRTVGVEQIVMQKSDEQFVQDGAIMAVETLAGKEIAWYIPNLNEGVRDVSPTARLFITQSLLEPLLKTRAQELGADLHFATEMISFEQDADGVTALIRERDSGKTSTVRAQYMIAADGSRSRIRERLGIKMLGHGVFSNSATIYFRGKVGPLLRGRNLSVIMVVNPVLSGFFRIEKPFDSGFLAVVSLGDHEHPNPDVSTGLNEQRCKDLVHAGLGTHEVPIEIENVMHWQAAADTAERFRNGRIFLAGDAAHIMPPYGGFGGNCGIHDAHNIAWKLALVLKGMAGPDLLATYEQERRPASEFTVEQAYTRYVARAASYLKAAGTQKQENDLNIELGYCYHSAAVIPDTENDSIVHENPRDSKGRPGTRAPHIWLQGQTLSTLDLFGGNFVLLTGPEGNWPRQIGLDTHVLPDQAACEAYGINVTGASLVRPDGFVGWRSKTGEGASQETLTRVLERLTCRPGV